VSGCEKDTKKVVNESEKLKTPVLSNIAKVFPLRFPHLKKTSKQNVEFQLSSIIPKQTGPTLEKEKFENDDIFLTGNRVVQTSTGLHVVDKLVAKENVWNNPTLVEDIVQSKKVKKKNLVKEENKNKESKPTEIRKRKRKREEVKEDHKSDMEETNKSGELLKDRIHKRNKLYFSEEYVNE
jgi:hypothetical protein